MHVSHQGAFRSWRLLLLVLATSLLLDRVAVAQLTRTKLNEVEQVARRLREKGDVAAADELQAEVDRFRQRLDDPTLPYDTSLRPERHSVYIPKTGPAPAGVIAGRERFKAGYAEVHVTYTARPVILKLNSDTPSYWKVTLADGVSLAALELQGGQKLLQEVPQTAPIVKRNQQARALLLSWRRRWPQESPWARMAISSVQRDYGTMLKVSPHDGKPVIVGPENVRWRESFLVPQVNALHKRATAPDVQAKEEAADREQERRHASVADLRFRAWFYSSSAFRQKQCVLAEFTVDGPQLNTVEGVDLEGAKGALAIDKETGDAYVIDNDHQLARRQRGEESFQALSLSFDGEFADNEVAFETMAHDTRRRRLLLRGHNNKLAAAFYDLATGKLSLVPHKLSISEVPGPRGVNSRTEVASLVYDDQEDAYFGLVSNFVPINRDNHSQLLRISVEGKPEAIITTKLNLGNPGFGSSAQLAATNGRLIALGSISINRKTPPVNVAVLDLATGETLYTGDFAANHKANNRSNSNLVAPPPTPPESDLDYRFADLLPFVGRDFAQLEQIIGKFEAAGMLEEANKLQQRLRLLREFEAGNFASLPCADDAMHVVSCLGATSVEVQVTAAASPGLLVLCSARPTAWKLRVEPEARIGKVIVGGNSEQTLEGVPAMTEVERVADLIIRENEQPYEVSIPELFHQALAQHVLTTLFIDTSPGDLRVTLGPADGDWRYQRLLSALEETLMSAPALPVVKPKPPQLAAFEFQALFFTPKVVDNAPFPGARTSTYDVDLAHFTIEGPLGSSFTPMPPGICCLTVDPRGPTYYGATSEDIVSIDPVTLATKSIGLPPDHHWGVQSIAFDTKRQRLLVSYWNAGHLAAYAPAEAKWTELKASGALAMTYDEKEDALYMFGRDPIGGGGGGFVRCTPEGISVSQITLSGNPRSAGMVPGPFARPGLQLKLFDRHFVLVAFEPSRRANIDGAPYIYVYGRESGELEYEGELAVHAGQAALGVHEIRKLFLELAHADKRAANVVMWRIADGGNAVIDPLERLTADAQSLQQRRATQILERIGTPESKARLDKWATDQAKPLRAGAASAALERMREAAEQSKQREKQKQSLRGRRRG